jgi:predicted nucleic acid-binding protein
MSAEYFLDTNVLIYSFDASAPTKQARAMALVERALIEGTGVISWQVVQEFLNVALHKWEVTMTYPDTLEFLKTTLYPLCQVHPSEEIFQGALRIQHESQYRFFDSLVVSSALHSGATTLFTEDLQDGRKFGTLTIRNPFH